MARVLLSAVPLVQDSAVGLARCFAYICKLGCTPGLLLIAQAGQPFAIPPAETAAELAADAQELDGTSGKGTQNNCSISVAESERFRITRRLKRSCP